VSSRNTLAAVLLVAAIAPNGVFAKSNRPATRAVSFPPRSRAVSPNGRYVIVGVDSDKEPYHTVFLHDRRLKTRRKLFNYDRWIELLWNPDSKSFALTDHAGSDFSECRIIPVDEKAQSIDVWDETVKGSAAREKRSFLENHHVYIAAKEWISSKTLKVKVWGYGELDLDGFTRYYLYEIGRGIRRYTPRPTFKRKFDRSSQPG
jgi:hypothetical protein